MTHQSLSKFCSFQHTIWGPHIYGLNHKQPDSNVVLISLISVPPLVL